MNEPMHADVRVPPRRAAAASSCRLAAVAAAGFIVFLLLPASSGTWSSSPACWTRLPTPRPDHREDASTKGEGQPVEADDQPGWSSEQDALWSRLPDRGFSLLGSRV